MLLRIRFLLSVLCAAVSAGAAGAVGAAAGAVGAASGAVGAAAGAVGAAAAGALLGGVVFAAGLTIFFFVSAMSLPLLCWWTLQWRKPLVNSIYFYRAINQVFRAGFRQFKAIFVRDFQPKHILTMIGGLNPRLADCLLGNCLRSLCEVRQKNRSFYS